MTDKELNDQLVKALSDRISEDMDRSIMGNYGEIWTSDDYKKKAMMEGNARDWQKQIMNDWERVRKNEEPLRQIMRDLDDMKSAMRKMGIMLNSDLPDDEAFERFRMLREAYRKYKMVEKLVLGQEKE